MSEAKSIKAEAEMSHREAARQIELESNKDKPIWELDLHGLHLAEANQAVDNRSIPPKAVQVWMMHNWGGVQNIGRGQISL